MKILKLIVNGFGENTYIVFDEATRECAIIDPGVSDVHEQDALVRAIEKYDLKPVHLINTHMHIDHVLGNKFVTKQYDLGVEANKADEFLGKRVSEQARMFGLPLDVADSVIESYLEDGDIVKIGESKLKVLAVPGHSPGSIALYCQSDSFVLTGDALFAGSIGRTDLPGGDFDTLIIALDNKIMTLPDKTVVYPGHGPATTVGQEKKSNPYLKRM